MGKATDFTDTVKESWLWVYNSGNGLHDIVTDTKGVASKAMEVSGRGTLQWNTEPTTQTDVEVWAKLIVRQTSSNMTRTGPALRTTAAGCYLACIISGNTLRLVRRSGTTDTFPTAAAAGYATSATLSRAAAVDDVINIKIKAQGTNILAKAYYAGETEPTSYQIGVADSTYASGGVGLATTSAAPTVEHYGFFSYGDIALPPGSGGGGTPEPGGTITRIYPTSGQLWPPVKEPELIFVPEQTP